MWSLHRMQNVYLCQPMKVLSFLAHFLNGILLCLLVPCLVHAQQNPFEIKGRTSENQQTVVDSQALSMEDILASTQSDLSASTEMLPDSVAGNDTIVEADTVLKTPDTASTTDTIAPNPFDQSSTVQSPPPNDPDPVQQERAKDTTDLLEGLKEISERLPELEIGQNQNILFVITVLILLFLAVLLAINRSMINKAYRAIANDNFLRFLFREYKSTAWLYWIFYSYFFINAGFFLYLTANYFGWYGGKLSLLILSIAVVSIVYLFKHISLQVMSGSFPVEKETQLYGFVTMLINILLGIVLTPINLVSAFAPEPFVKWAILLGIFTILSLYVFRQLKGLFISGRFLNSYRFHFFIYLCTAEIAPLLIIGKLAVDNIGF